MPNTFAYFMLAMWPVVTVVMFRRLPVERAFIWSLLGGYLILPPPPAAFDFPLMPPLTKDSLPSLATFLTYVAINGLPRPLLPRTTLGRTLALIFIFSPIATVVTNTEPVFFGQIGIKALGAKDMIALTVLQFMLLLPFLLARHILGTAKGQRELIMAIFIGGLAYSLPMLAEVRLSPQLNIWIYGYFQHYFEQMIRDGGFRPIVFLYHGLWVAFFAMLAFVAALTLARAERSRTALLYFLAALYMFAVLVLCKSLGSLIFAVFLAPLVILLPTGMQLRVAAVIAAIAVGYPILKGAGLIPVDWMINQAAQINPERAASLQFRMDNEAILMDRAYQKPLFGWGSWGRNHILNSVTGEIETVTDGRWIILIGIFGWFGFLAEFGLIALPIWLIWLEWKRIKPENVTPYMGPMVLILSVNLIDMIPNATLTTLTWLFAGSLMGYAEYLRGHRETRKRLGLLNWRSVM